jgi:hypothetical protein
MSIYAEKLSVKAEFAGKYAKLTKETLGDNYATWKSTIVDCLGVAYKVYEVRHNNGMAKTVNVDMSALYSKVYAVRDMIGEVNGMKLNSELLAEALIGISHTFRKACYSDAAATADCNLDSAKASKRTIEKRPITDTFTETAKAQALAQAQTAIDSANARIDELMQIAGNYRDIPCPVSETMFLANAEKELRTIVNNQNAKSWEQVQAEKQALKEARKNNRKNNK